MVVAFQRQECPLSSCDRIPKSFDIKALVSDYPACLLHDVLLQAKYRETKHHKLLLTSRFLHRAYKPESSIYISGRAPYIRGNTVHTEAHTEESV